MTDTMTIDQARAMVAQADAAVAADRQAKADVATAAVKALVAGDAFKAAHTAMEDALQSAPKDVELSYAVQMMDRIAARYPAPAA